MGNQFKTVIATYNNLILKMEKFCLKWNDFQSNVSASFGKLRAEKDFFDVTLVSDDEVHISSHKVVLSSSSDFFKNILRKSSHTNPLIYLPGIKSNDLNYIMDYIYNGEVQLFQGDLDTFLEVAKKLKVDGLIGDNQTSDQEENTNQNSNDKPFLLKEEDYVEEVDVTSTEIQTSERKARRLPIPYAVSTKNNEAKEAVDQLVKNADNMFECKSCGRTARSSSDIRRHVEIHIEGLSFDCQICGNSFRTRCSLAKHYKKHKQEWTISQSYNSTDYEGIGWFKTNDFGQEML